MAVEREGRPSLAIVAGLTPNGARALANSRDTDLLQALMTEPWEGKKVTVTNDGTTNRVEG